MEGIEGTRPTRRVDYWKELRHLPRNSCALIPMLTNGLILHKSTYINTGIWCPSVKAMDLVSKPESI